MSERIQEVDNSLEIVRERIGRERTIPLFKTTVDELYIVIDALLDRRNELSEQDEE